jgi:hypothetical protein
MKPLVIKRRTKQPSKQELRERAQRIANPEPELPPVEPSTRADLDEAVMLLGNLVAAERSGAGLRDAVRQRLKVLVGKCPTSAATAARWKTALKRVRDDEVFDDADDPADEPA